MGWEETLIGVGGDIAAAYLGRESAKDAAEASAAAMREGQAVSEEAIKRGREDILATVEPGLEDLIAGFQGAVSALDAPGTAEYEALALSGALGAEEEQRAIDAMVTGPGQKWLEEEQERALVRNAGALGDIGSGRVRTALQEEAFGRAATQKQQRFQNLAALINPEQTRSTNIANILSTGGQQLAQYRGGIGSSLANLSVGGAAQQIPLITGAGIAKAGGVVGANTAVQQGISNVGSTLGKLVA